MTYTDPSLARGLTNRMFKEGQRSVNRMRRKLDRTKFQIASKRAGACHRAFVKLMCSTLGDDVIRHLKAGEGSNLTEQLVYWEYDKAFTELGLAVLTSSPKMWRRGRQPPNAFPLFIVRRHAIERVFERMNVQDVATVKIELLHILPHLDNHIASYDGSPPEDSYEAEFDQTYIPTPHGAAIAEFQTDLGLVIPTWLAETTMTDRVRRRWNKEFDVAAQASTFPRHWKIEDTK